MLLIELLSELLGQWHRVTESRLTYARKAVGEDVAPP
jgi:hypothetical protein